MSLVCHLLLWWSHQALGANWQPDLAIRKSHQLITDRPYNWVRHPMYLSFILLGMGMTLIAANWIITFFILTTPISEYLRRSKQEEDMLEEAFGEVYRDYMSRTGSLLPKIKFKYFFLKASFTRILQFHSTPLACWKYAQHD